MASISTVTAPTDTSGLLASALNQTAVTTDKTGVTNATAATADKVAGTATASTYKPTSSTATNYQAQDMTAQGYTADKSDYKTYDAQNASSDSYNAMQAALSKWEVDPNQLVENRIDNLLKKDNPLMVQAAARANQSMNNRGLLNSSMAVRAGESALYDYAVPIATTDAATLANSAKYNADAANQMSQFNVGAQNAAAQFNTNAKNQVALANQAAQNAAAQFGASAFNTTELANQAAENQASQFTATAQNAAAAANQSAQNAASQFNAQNTTQVSLANQAAENTAGQFNANAQNQTSQFNAAAQNSLQSQNLSNQQQTNIANAQAANTATQNDAQRALTATMANVETSKALVMQQLDSAFKAQVANADNQTKVQLQSMQNSTQLSLANIEAKYKTSMQTSQSASNMYQQVVKNITDVVNNPDLDQEAKDAAIAIQTGMLNESLQAFNAIAETGISNSLNFDPVDTRTTADKTAANKAEIESLYASILGRNADAAGLAHWLKIVDTGQMSLAEVKNAFYNSTEYATKSFDSAAYLQKNPDVAAAIANGTWKGTAYDHFKQYGLSEGRI